MGVHVFRRGWISAWLDTVKIGISLFLFSRPDIFLEALLHRLLGTKYIDPLVSVGG